jgi:hypothetical protein
MYIQLLYIWCYGFVRFTGYGCLECSCWGREFCSVLVGHHGHSLWVLAWWTYMMADQHTALSNIIYIYIHIHNNWIYIYTYKKTLFFQTTTFIIKQNRHTVSTFVFYFVWDVILLRVSTLLLGHLQAYAIRASVTESIWIHFMYMVINFAILIRLKCNAHCQYLVIYLKLI